MFIIKTEKDMIQMDEDSFVSAKIENAIEA
jgi:hypothetical protein